MVLRYDEVGHGQAEACAYSRGFGGEEGFEDSAADVRRQAGAVVFDFDGHAAGVFARADGDCWGLVWSFLVCHGLRRIFEQIKEHLFNLGMGTDNIR